MAEWFRWLLLIPLVALPGVLLVACFLPRGTRWGLPMAFAALTLGLIALGWVALVLAEWGRFSYWAVAAVIVALTAVLLAWRALGRDRGKVDAAPPIEDRLARWEWLMLAAWLVVALWLFSRPHETIRGGADAGVYVSLGAEIARNGGFRIADETLAALPADVRAAVVRPLPNTPGADAYLLPGFYVTGAGELTPQFYPLHPALQAVAFAAAGGGAPGVRTALLLPGLWALLGALAVWLAARDVGGPLVGALALAGLSLSALQVWFGRYPTSEALTQFLLWAGIWSGGRWLGEHRLAGLWAFVAGSAFGAVFLVRIDAVVLLPVFALVFVWRWARGWGRADTWAAVPLTALAAHSLLHGHFLSAPYFYETLGYGVFLLQRLWPALLIAVVVVAGLLWWLLRRAGDWHAPERWHARERWRRPVLAALAGLLLGYALYGWFLRPELMTATARPDVFSGGEIPVLNHENWPRLGWYLTPLGVWLGVLGGCLLVWRLERRTFLLATIGWLFAALYLWNISANPHHVYVMRRYVPVVAPFFILGAAYLLGQGLDRAALPNRFRSLPFPIAPALAVLAAVLWLGGLAWAARGFVSRVDYAGLTAQVDALAGRLPAGAALLFDDQSIVGQGDVWGTPLRFIYGHDAFALRRPPATISAALVETIKTWQNSGRAVVWVGDPAWLDEQGFAYRPEEVVLTGDRLESSYDHKPLAVVTDAATLRLNFLESNE